MTMGNEEHLYIPTTCVAYSMIWMKFVSPAAKTDAMHATALTKTRDTGARG